MEEHIVKPITNRVTSVPAPFPSPASVEEATDVTVDSDRVEEAKIQTIEIPDVHKKDSIPTIQFEVDSPYYIADPLFYKLTDYLGLNTREADFYKNRIIEIMNWGRENSPTKDDGDVLSRIKDLESRLATGMYERRHAVLYRYIMLQQKKTNVEKEMRVWEKT